MSATALPHTLLGHWARPGGVEGPYPVRASGDLQTGLSFLSHRHIVEWWQRRRTRPGHMLARVNALETVLRTLDDDALDARVNTLHHRLCNHSVTVDGAAESFALIREIARRSLGLRHHDVQLMAGWALLNGQIAEMSTGEGKTLSATLAAATAALAGTPVHIITVNDYLAARDAQSMSPLYARLGIQVGVVREGDDSDQRRLAYQQAVVYCSNKQLIFDFLQDQLNLGARSNAARMKLDRLFGRHARSSNLLLRGLPFAIVDEADSVLIDEARTPMILARESEDSERLTLYREALDIASTLQIERDFLVDRHARNCSLTARGRDAANDACKGRCGVWRGRRQREQLLLLALNALHAYERDEDYVVKDEKVCIVDPYTGRVLGDRSWQGGLQQLIELKEQCEPSRERETIARISQQRFFSRYLRLSGMSGTVREVRGELKRVYQLRYARIPTHRPSKRRYLGERVFTNCDAKWQAVTQRVVAMHQAQRPVLVGTRSIEDSMRCSEHLHAAGVAHQVLNANQDAQEAAIIARAGERGQVTVATNMAGRGTDIALADSVDALGGLHVIACERHEAARIDRQLFGRAARQGNTGSCERIGCLDDELMRLYLPVWLRRLSRLCTPGQRIVTPLGVLISAMTQRRAERDRARQRKAVMEADRRMDRMLSFTGAKS